LSDLDRPRQQILVADDIIEQIFAEHFVQVSRCLDLNCSIETVFTLLPLMINK